MTPFEFGQYYAKHAAAVERGGQVSSITADTLGRVLGLPSLLLTTRALHNSAVKGRDTKHKDIADAMSRAEPDALKDTVVRLNGTNLVDDLLWKKERDGQDLPWYKQVGGRVWHNPRTGPLGKLLGTVSTPIASLMTSLTRGSHYNPEADSAAIFADEPAITSHELGHAIDFNSLVPRESKGLRRFGRQLARDAYRMTYIPILNLFHENEANRHSYNALRKGLADNPEAFDKIERDRNSVLPAGYGSYIGQAVNTAYGGMLPVAPLVGAVLGKSWGRTLNSLRDVEDAQRQKANMPVPAT